MRRTRVAAAVPASGGSGRNPEETREAIRDVDGFAVERVVDLLPYHYGLVFSR
jgi:hypothetical protein